LAYTLASILFRYKRYVVIVANTEELANKFLENIRSKVRHNKDLREDFGIKSLSVDGATKAVIDFHDGHQAMIETRGAGQKPRGLLWDDTRPDLMVVDDLEDDEGVMSDDRRKKLKSWFLKALHPALSENGQVRMVGTILHNDSLLMNFVEDSSWESQLYKAHNSFDDFGGLLWPEMWPEQRLRLKQQTFIAAGDPEGYSQEYLNDPSDLQNPYFKETDFIPMNEDDHRVPKTYYVGVDFALSDKTHSDYTVMVVGGYDADGMLHIVDERRVRTDDTAVIIDELFSVMSRWQPDMYLFEGGVIANSLEPTFRWEMRRRNKFSTIHTYTPIQDKALRANSIQQRMRSGGVKYDMEASWFTDHMMELRAFPRGKKKDRVDAVAWLGRGVDEFVEAPTEEDLEIEAWEQQYEDYQEDENPYVSVAGYY